MNALPLSLAFLDPGVALVGFALAVNGYKPILIGLIWPRRQTRIQLRGLRSQTPGANLVNK